MRCVDGSVDTYESKVDACRASSAVALDLEEKRQLRDIKRLWGSELAAAATARASRFGCVEVDMTSLPESLLTSWLQQAHEKCAILSRLIRVDFVFRFVSIDHENAFWAHVLRAKPQVMASLLEERAWLSNELRGEFKRKVVSERCVCCFCFDLMSVDSNNQGKPCFVRLCIRAASHGFHAVKVTFHLKVIEFALVIVIVCALGTQTIRGAASRSGCAACCRRA